MNDRENKRTPGIQRYSIASERTSAMHIIPFADLIKHDHVARIVDMSVVGVGIVSKKQVEKGLVIFEEPVGGHRFGVVTWCKASGAGYRAGINFVTLSPDQEQYILLQVKESSHKSLRDPEKIIETLLSSIRPGTNG